METISKTNIYRLLTLRGFSQFGTSMYEIVLPLLVLELTGSLTNVGMFYSVIKLPGILLLPFLGVLVERFSRKKILFFCNLLMFTIFFIQFIFFSMGNIWIALLALLGMMMSISNSVSDIATRVLFTENVPRNQLEKWNGTKSMIDNGALFIAPMLGTFLYGLWHINVVLVIILILYAVALIGIYSLHYQPPKTMQEKSSTTVFKEMHEGFLFVKSQKTIFAFFILAMTLNFFVASTEEIINPGILITKYQLPQELFGFSSTFHIIGVILAGFFIARNCQFDFQKNLNKLFIINSLIMIAIGGLSLLLSGFSMYVYFSVFLFMQILLGFFTILINVPLTSYFQANVPLQFQGRFFAFFSFAANLSIPFGISYTGVIANHLGADITYMINNSCVILIVWITYRFFNILGNQSEN